MAERICSIEDCEKPMRCRNLCGTHYDRVRRTGSPHLPPERRCEIEGCDRKHAARGLCNAHYLRLRAGLDLSEPVRKVPTAEERADIETRILDRCTFHANGCIEWTGYKIPSGYGTIHWQGRDWVVHRAMWTAKVGPIPTDDDWTLDHLCRNRACVNVDHLEVVTRIENSRRGGGLEVAHALAEANPAANRTHCINGHKYTTETTTWSKGQRYCRTCRKEQWAKRKDRVNAEIRAKRRAERLSAEHRERCEVRP